MRKHLHQPTPFQQQAGMRITRPEDRCPAASDPWCMCLHCSRVHGHADGGLHAQRDGLVMLTQLPA